MVRPRIGITRSCSAGKPVDEVHPSYRRYHDRVREAGGEPVDLHPALGDAPEVLLAGLDGVIIAGGPDVNPDRYGQAHDPHTAGIDDGRDVLELGLLRAALARDLPVFAICRGHQALNVAAGGGLLQHIAGDGHSAAAEPPHDSRMHGLTIVPDSRLYRLLGVTEMETNSRHHQAVTPAVLAPGLAPTAWSPDGLIEGLESPAHRWVLGVQWHPEREEVQDRFRLLFADFIAAASVRTAPAAGRG